MVAKRGSVSLARARARFARAGEEAWYYTASTPTPLQHEKARSFARFRGSQPRSRRKLCTRRNAIFLPGVSSPLHYSLDHYVCRKRLSLPIVRKDLAARERVSAYPSHLAFPRELSRRRAPQAPLLLLSTAHTLYIRARPRPASSSSLSPSQDLRETTNALPRPLNQ